MCVSSRTLPATHLCVPGPWGTAPSPRRDCPALPPPPAEMKEGTIEHSHSRRARRRAAAGKCRSTHQCLRVRQQAGKLVDPGPEHLLDVTREEDGGGRVQAVQLGGRGGGGRHRGHGAGGGEEETAGGQGDGAEDAMEGGRGQRPSNTPKHFGQHGGMGLWATVLAA